MYNIILLEFYSSYKVVTDSMISFSLVMEHDARFKNSELVSFLFLSYYLSFFSLF